MWLVSAAGARLYRRGTSSLIRCAAKRVALHACQIWQQRPSYGPSTRLPPIPRRGWQSLCAAAWTGIPETYYSAGLGNVPWSWRHHAGQHPACRAYHSTMPGSVNHARSAASAVEAAADQHCATEDVHARLHAVTDHTADAASAAGPSHLECSSQVYSETLALGAQHWRHTQGNEPADDCSVLA